MKIAVIAGLVLLLLAWVGTGLMGQRVLGQLLESLYTNDKTNWLKEGNPYAFYAWSPPEGKSIFGNAAGTVLAYRLLFITPTWLPAIPNGSSFHSRIKILFSIHILSLIACFTLFLSLAN